MRRVRVTGRAAARPHRPTVAKKVSAIAATITATTAYPQRQARPAASTAVMISGPSAAPALQLACSQLTSRGEKRSAA